MTETHKMTDIGIIPNDWKVMTIEEVGHSFSYGVGAEAIPFDGKNKYIRITDIDDKSAQYRPSPIMSPSFFYEQHVLKECDIVVARTGASVGKSYLYNKNDGRLIFAGFLMKLNVAGCNATYLAYHLQTNQYKQWVNTESARTGQPGLNIEQLKQFSFPTPTNPDEQNSIAYFLATVDSFINAIDRAISKKKLMKEGTMQQLLTGKTRLNGYYEQWIEIELGELGIMKSGGTPSTNTPEYWGGDVDWLQSGAVQNCIIYPEAVSLKITELGLSKSAAHLISKDSVLIAITGATCANIGYLTFESAANQSVVSIEPYEDTDAMFLYQKLLTERDKILSNRGGSAQGGVTLNQLKKLVITIPSNLEEQKSIATILKSMDVEIAALEAEKNKYISIKQGMMQKLLTGQIRLPQSCLKEE